MNALVAAWGDVRRIAVFRALVLGDVLCAVPTFRALRRAFPGAELLFVGLPWAEAWAARCPHIDRFMAFPGHASLPERAPDAAAVPGFLDAVRSLRVDVAMQLHGSGGITNAIVGEFGARHTAGFAEPGAPGHGEPGFCPWPDAGSEVERLLGFIDHLGLPRAGTALEYPLHPRDDEDLHIAWPELDAQQSIVCVHPGAQLPSRRWLPERFAAVADRLAADGHTVVLTGTAGEAALVHDVAAAMHAPAVNLAGRTTLWTLGALIRRARLLVCNDTGVSHVAAALRTPSVVVSLGADVHRWAPADASRHRVLWHPVACRPCGHRECPVGHGCATSIEPGPVVRAARQQLELQPA